jgi:transcriptional regulator with XRE-family HTH domain
MKKHVGLVIKQLRNDNNLKQIYMAHKLNLTLESYANIEQGRVDINTEKLKRIATILGIQASEIISAAEAII